MSIKYSFKTKTFAVAEYREDVKSPCNSPHIAAEIMRVFFAELDQDVEHFVLVALNSKSKVIGFKIIGQGTATATLAHPREILRSALVLGATAFLIAHNHPSGNPSPSREDAALTDRVRRGGDSIDVPLADHIILGSEDTYYSFRRAQGWDYDSR